MMVDRYKDKYSHQCQRINIMNLKKKRYYNMPFHMIEKYQLLFDIAAILQLQINLQQ